MRVPVILHERLGTWIRQLRPRLYDRPVRWFESRASSDLEALLSGLALPLVLIDLGRDAAAGLRDIGLVSLRVPDARILAIDAGGRPDVAAAAREIGATHVFSGFVPPPVVAELMSHWITAARMGIERAGWSRTTFPDTETDPWSWLSDYLDGPGTAAQACRLAPRDLDGRTSVRMTKRNNPRIAIGHEALRCLFSMKDED